MRIPSLSRLAPVASIAALLLTPAPPAAAFLETFSLTRSGASFTFVVGSTTQWALDDFGGSGDIYTGIQDSARFSGTFGFSFSDAESIRRNGALIEAKLKGKVSSDCSSAKVTLKDSANDVTVTLVWPSDVAGAALTCNPL